MTKITNGVVITKISRPTGPVKLYATVPSSSRPDHRHTVCYLRKPGMKRWTCTCEDKNVRKAATGKHCRHIKRVRAIAIEF